MQKVAYVYDLRGIYHSTQELNSDLGDFKEGQWLVPAFSTLTPPPQEIPEGLVAKFNPGDNSWELIGVVTPEGADSSPTPKELYLEVLNSTARKDRLKITYMVGTQEEKNKLIGALQTRYTKTLGDIEKAGFAPTSIPTTFLSPYLDICPVCGLPMEADKCSHCVFTLKL